MYAISFDFNSDELKKEYGDTSKAYNEIEKELEKFDFVWLNGSVYVNYHGKNSLAYVYKVINRLSTLYWFKKSVRDITVFKIENLSNFTPIVK